MPSIELDGHSEAKFELVDGKIIRIDAVRPPAIEQPRFDVERLRD